MDFPGLEKRNAATAVNPGPANYSLTRGGSSFLWAWFCAMTLSQVILLFYTYLRVPVGRRALHWIGVGILTCASLHYWLKASNLGGTAIHILYHGYLPNPRSLTRQIFYVKWVEYTITVPLTILLLLLPTAIPLADLLLALFVSAATIIFGGLISSLIASTYKFGAFVIGVGLWFWLLGHMWTVGLRSARHLGGDILRRYMMLLAYISFFWSLYAVAWGCSDASNLITVTSGAIWFGILDLVCKPIFLAIYFVSLKNIDYERFGFLSNKASFSLTPAEYASAHGAAAPIGTSTTEKTRIEQPSATTPVAPSATGHDNVGAPTLRKPVEHVSGGSTEQQPGYEAGGNPGHQVPGYPTAGETLAPPNIA